MNPIIANKISQLEMLCKKYQVATMYVFGSVTTDKFNENSDIDFLIAFRQDISIEEYTNNYFELQYHLRDLFKRKIDLVTENSLSNPYFIQSVEKTKKLLYAA